MKFEPAFQDAVSRATGADGASFATFLADAEMTFVDSNRRKRERKPAIMPAKGFAPGLRRTIRTELPMLPGETLEMKWTSMPTGEFLDVDMHSKTLWLNSQYRSLFAPAGGSMNDAPVLKALLYLLTHSVFEGRYLGAKDKDDIALWKSVLTAAADAERRMKDGD